MLENFRVRQQIGLVHSVDLLARVCVGLRPVHSTVQDTCVYLYQPNYDLIIRRQWHVYRELEVY